jgi:hypothetical protein
MYSLVCEGACNPDVNELSGLVIKAGRTENSKVGKTVRMVSVLPESTLKRLRELVHTPHEASYSEPGDGDMYACVKCGHRRRFGL